MDAKTRLFAYRVLKTGYNDYYFILSCTHSKLKAIRKERLFVLHLPEIGDVETAPDITDTNLTDAFELAKLRSPIGLFVLREDGILRIAAIQRDPVAGWFFLISIL